MVIEHRTYNVKPGAVQDLMDLYEKEGMEVHRNILGNQIGYFYTEIGPLNQIVHLYGYKSLDDRAERRARLANDVTWKKFITKGINYIIDQESKILIPAQFSAIK